MYVFVYVCVNKRLSGVQMSRPVVKAILSTSPENSSSNSSSGSLNSRSGGGKSSGSSFSEGSYSRITCSQKCVTF